MPGHNLLLMLRFLWDFTKNDPTSCEPQDRRYPRPLNSTVGTINICCGNCVTECCELLDKFTVIQIDIYITKKTYLCVCVYIYVCVLCVACIYIHNVRPVSSKHTNNCNRHPKKMQLMCTMYVCNRYMSMCISQCMHVCAYVCLYVYIYIIHI